MESLHSNGAGTKPGEMPTQPQRQKHQNNIRSFTNNPRSQESIQLSTKIAEFSKISKIDEDMKTFQDKHNSRQFMQSKPAHQKILRGILYAKEDNLIREQSRIIS